MQPPNDQRNFVHKRIGRAVGGFITGGPAGAARGFLTSGGRRPSGRSGGAPVARRDFGSAAAFAQARAAQGFSASQGRDRCPKGQRMVAGVCVGFGGLSIPRAEQFPGTDIVLRGGTAAAAGAYAPQVDMVDIRRCFPGDILGKDGLCHAKGSIPNKERAHPRGRRPLGTPGEMAALAKAASFGRRMESTIKRMQKIGVVKRPTPRRKMITSAAQHHAGG